MFRSIRRWLSKQEDTMDIQVRQAIANDRTCTILRLVLENPGIPGQKLADRSQINHSEVMRYLDSLLLAGLIEADPDTGYSVTEAAKAAVIRHLPLNYQCPGMLR